MKKLLVWMCIVLLPAMGWAQPETGKAEQENDAVTMNEVVVSVTRMETRVDKIGGNSVSVITADDIASKNMGSVADILKTVPGIDVASNGGPGTRTSVFMRGADSKNTLVLIDGIMMNDPSQANRGANLANLSLDNIERIEVVRGAMSVMYGSNATAGVINIITKKGNRDPEFFAGVECGAYGMWKMNGGASGATEKLDYALSASRLDTDGFSTADADNPDIPHNGNTDEKDGYENTTLSGKMGMIVTDHFNVSGVVRYINSMVELDDYASGYVGDNIGSSWVEDPPGSGNWVETVTPFPDGPTGRRTESDQVFAKVSAASSHFNDRFESSLSYGFAHQERQSYDNEGEEDYDYKGNTHELAWQGALNFKYHTISFGLSSFQENMDSESSGTGEKDASTSSGWCQEQLFVGDLVIVTGMRLDNHDEFGNKATFRFSPSYEVGQTGITIKGSYGTGFRSPSLFELYSEYGNQDLEAEESKGWDLGFAHVLKDRVIRYGMTWFAMIYDDHIGYDSATSRYNQLPGQTRTKGVESFLGVTPADNISFLLSHTYTHTEDPDGEQLERRPENRILLNTRYDFSEKGNIDLDIIRVEKRKASQYAMDGDGNSVDELDPYTLVNVSASYDVNDHCRVYCRIENLLDKYYEEAWSYATPGNSAYVGIKLLY